MAAHRWYGTPPCYSFRLHSSSVTPTRISRSVCSAFAGSRRSHPARNSPFAGTTDRLAKLAGGDRIGTGRFAAHFAGDRRRAVCGSVHDRAADPALVSGGVPGVSLPLDQSGHPIVSPGPLAHLWLGEVVATAGMIALWPWPAQAG